MSRQHETRRWFLKSKIAFRAPERQTALSRDCGVSCCHVPKPLLFRNPTLFPTRNLDGFRRNPVCQFEVKLFFRNSSVVTHLPPTVIQCAQAPTPCDCSCSFWISAADCFCCSSALAKSSRAFFCSFKLNFNHCATSP